MPKASIVVPAFNAAATLAETLGSLQRQSFPDFEVIIVDDGSTDGTAELAAGFLRDPRFKIVQQPNRGLAGARNTGISAAAGAYVGLCDADDLWLPQKLERHVMHLEANPELGVSYSGSRMITGSGRAMRMRQSPRLRGITAAHIFKRNPVGNGSAAVIRRAALSSAGFAAPGEPARRWYFDETFRQSEDIEFWLRMALTTDWQFAGIPGHLTCYRIARAGLSASTGRQYQSWERMVRKLQPLHPGFFDRHTPAARAYQLRYLTRRAVSAADREKARSLARQVLRTSRVPLREEPLKTLSTLAAAGLLSRTGLDPMRLAAALRPQ